uniref:Uncharacterized protein n=1 Tax=Schlesneria paludicola TaxID=360056 RepID=A0A7C4LN52_9PLAN
MGRVGISSGGWGSGGIGSGGIGSGGIGSAGIGSGGWGSAGMRPAGLPFVWGRCHDVTSRVGCPRSIPAFGKVDGVVPVAKVGRGSSRVALRSRG